MFVCNSRYLLVFYLKKLGTLIVGFRYPWGKSPSLIYLMWCRKDIPPVSALTKENAGALSIN